MADYGAIYADKTMAQVNRKLRSTYKTAQRELEKKLQDFNKRFAVKDKQQRAKRDAGEISEQDYKNWLAGQVFMRGQWMAKIEQVNQVMLHHNEQAMKIVNESKLDVFAENYNYQAFLTEKEIIGTSFNIYNTQAVARLILDDPQILPEWKIDQQKDYKWNYQKVNNIVKQGIIQGEGIPEITKRLCEDLSTMNENRMRTFARTAITGAQNAGRQQQMNDAAELGINVHKQWLATLDARTRDAHRGLDGQEVPYNEDFESDLGPIEYPGDPSADPANVYNCRCTMVTVYPEYEDRSKRNWREDEEIDGLAYEDWKKGKEERGEIVKLSQPYYPYKSDVETEEKKIAEKGKEVAVCIDRKTGRTIFTATSNNVDSVTFTKWQLTQMLDNTVTHNHPNGSTFSYDDIKTSFDYGVKEIRACHGNATYSLLRLFNVGDMLPAKYYSFASDYDAEIKRYDNEVVDRVYKITHNSDRCNKMLDKHARKWLKRNAEQYGWRYKEEWKK